MENTTKHFDASGRSLPFAQPASSGQVATMPRVHRSLFGDAFDLGKPEEATALLQKIALDAEGVEGAKPSTQAVSVGEKAHPFDMEGVARLMVTNTHHSACILTKRDATTGLGFVSDKIADSLDECCAVSFLDTLNQVGEDFWQTGNGYMEVVRDESGAISGLHHIPAKQTYVWLEDEVTYDIHYMIRGSEGAERRFARFGDRDDFLARYPDLDPLTVSEVIHFKQPSALSRWYGVPNWLSAVACIELVMAILQHNYDFFNNRGVPEFILFLLGKKVEDPDWKKIEAGIKATIGQGNGHKSMAINLPDPNMTVQLEKLTVDGGNTEATFEKFLDTLSLKIVSAHRVPPLLAGIQIPGKLGANNELPNSMAAFQSLVIKPAQTTFAHTLGATIGHPKLGFKKGIRGKKSFEFATILDDMNVEQLTAQAGTRTPVGPAQAGAADKPAPKPKPKPTKKVVKAGA